MGDDDNSSDEDAEFANFDLEAAILAASPHNKCTPPTEVAASSSSTTTSNLLRRQTPSTAPLLPKENNNSSGSGIGLGCNDDGIPSSSPRRAHGVYPLTLVSWNIAELAPSDSAPRGKSNEIRRQLETPRMVREICLLRESSSPSPTLPDIIALQECPYPSFGQSEFGPFGYISAGTVASHCGYVDLLVRKELISSTTTTTAMLQQQQPPQQPTTTTTTSGDGDDGYRYSTPPPRPTAKRSREEEEEMPEPPLRMNAIPTSSHHLPSVAATIALPDSTTTTIAISSSHLTWSKEGASERRNQYTSLMRLMLRHSENCILLGDFNMRAAEDIHAETALLQELNNGVGWTDAWKASSSSSSSSGPIHDNDKEGDASKKFTWDSFLNKYHADGFRYRARYDRCYFRGEDIVGVERFDLIGNRPVEDRPGDYLSDHFGVVVVLGVKKVREEQQDALQSII